MAGKMTITKNDVLELLDDYLTKSDSERWSAFYSDTKKEVSIFY